MPAAPLGLIGSSRPGNDAAVLSLISKFYKLRPFSCDVTGLARAIWFGVQLPHTNT